MKGCKRLIRFTVANLVGITFAISIGNASAQQTLQPGQTTSGIISESTSRLFVFEGKQYLGDEYTFESKGGDSVRIAVVPEAGSRLQYRVILIGPSGQVGQINNSQRELFLSGTWKIRVLALRKTQGRYQISLVKKVDQGEVLNEFLKKQLEADERRRREVEAKRREEEAKRREEENLIPASWGLTRVGCGGSGVVEISINAKLACALPTADLPAGRYAYDQARNELVPLSVPSAVNVNSPNQGDGTGF